MNPPVPPTVQASASRASAAGLATTAASASKAGSSKDKISVGSKAIVCQDADLRGEITIGSGCVIHPLCSIHAFSGPIILGDCCIVEETAVIVNKSTEPMLIGSYNLFEVGCRIEARQIGSYNTFEAKSKVTSSIIMGDYCTVGAACTLDADTAASPEDLATAFPSSTAVAADGGKGEGTAPEVQEAIPEAIREDTSTGDETTSKPANEDKLVNAGMESIPSYTVVYGRENARRKWSGEGKGQQTALMHKHLAYLTEMLPKYSRLKLFT